MKKLTDFIGVNESAVGDVFNDNNAKRIGKPMIDSSGNEVKNSVVLDPWTYAEKEGGSVRIHRFAERGNKDTSLTLVSKSASALKKLL